jgi:peptidoglycan-N-acetylglucosamine deacetylase
MKSPRQQKLLISLDVDSPAKLLNFHRIQGDTFGGGKLDAFYRTSWDRALAFFDALDIKATFFVVGDELEGSGVIRDVVRRAYAAGHEIENHTYSHPFGLASLPDQAIREEIVRCNEVIEKTTGVAPAGFRSPGYSVNSRVVNIAADLGLKYDSSGFWSILNPVLRIFHRLLFKNGLSNPDFGMVTSRLKQHPYRPSPDNWLVPDSRANPFWELPFPRTDVFALPFYNNFNLWSFPAYTNYVSKRINRPYMMYLFHIIEFMDLSDGLPAGLVAHPNVRMPVRDKLRRSKAVMSNLLERYEWMPAREFVGSLSNGGGTRE